MSFTLFTSDWLQWLNWWQHQTHSAQSQIKCTYMHIAHLHGQSAHTHTHVLICLTSSEAATSSSMTDCSDSMDEMPCKFMRICAGRGGVEIICQFDSWLEWTRQRCREECHLLRCFKAVHAAHSQQTRGIAACNHHQHLKSHSVTNACTHLGLQSGLLLSCGHLNGSDLRLFVKQIVWKAVHRVLGKIC